MFSFRATALFMVLLMSSEAFVPSISRSPRKATCVERSAIWQNWLPDSDDNLLITGGVNNDLNAKKNLSQDGLSESEDVEMNARTFFLGALLATALIAVPSTSVLAVSGGGLDFAGLDISGQDFSSNSYKGKDFTQVIAKGTTFAKSNLQGCRFYKSYLVNVDFTGADITGASLEGTSMDGASLKDSIAKGTYFSKSILDTASVENADFSDAQFPPKVLPLLCDREDMKGTNPTTGADTRESAMCL